MIKEESIAKEETSFIVNLVTKVLITLFAFFIVNFYSNYKFDLENFLSDFPGFWMARNLQWTIYWVYPVIFVAVGLLIERFSKGSRLTKRLVVLLGQTIFSICFFYILWYIMFNIPGYPSPVDQSLIMEAFFWYCVFTFFTLCILASDDFKYLTRYIIQIIYRLHKRRD